MPYLQDSPNAVQVEVTEGCPLRCSFCGLHGIRDKGVMTYRYMTPELAGKLAADIASAGWNSRIEFAMHGEPTMNPELVQIVAQFRTALPKNQLMVTSNAHGLVKKGAVDALFAAGLNVLAVDDYLHASHPKKLRAMLAGQEHPYEVLDYPGDGLQYSPHHRFPVSTRRVLFVQDITVATAGGHAKLNNHCGAAAPPDHSLDAQRCAKPFRELSVRWDGTVALCCNDWRGAYVIGSAQRQSLESIWQHPRFMAARRVLLSEGRRFAPCAGCNATTYRNGLLPDRMGKRGAELGAPTKEDRKHIAAAMREGPATTPVLRPWEQK